MLYLRIWKWDKWSLDKWLDANASEIATLNGRPTHYTKLHIAYINHLLLKLHKHRCACKFFYSKDILFFQLHCCVYAPWPFQLLVCLSWLHLVLLRPRISEHMSLHRKHYHCTIPISIPAPLSLHSDLYHSHMMEDHHGNKPMLSGVQSLLMLTHIWMHFLLFLW